METIRCRYCDQPHVTHVAFVGYVCQRHHEMLSAPLLLDGVVDSLSVCEMAAAIGNEFEQRVRRLQLAADHACCEVR